MKLLIQNGDFRPVSYTVQDNMTIFNEKCVLLDSLNNKGCLGWVKKYKIKKSQKRKKSKCQVRLSILYRVMSVLKQWGSEYWI